MRVSAYVLVPALIGLLVAGCSSTQKVEPKVIELKAVDMSFVPKELTVDKGQPYKLIFTNQDSQLHDFSIKTIPVKGGQGHNDGHDMGKQKFDVHVSADAGKTGEVEFTPTKAGKYEFYCTVAGHKDAGAFGTLIVK